MSRVRTSASGSKADAMQPEVRFVPESGHPSAPRWPPLSADSVAKVGGARGFSVWRLCEAQCQRHLCFAFGICGSCLGGYNLRRGGHELGQTSQVLGDSRQHELILRASGSTQTKPSEPQDALEVREPHLDAFTLVPRSLEGFGPAKETGDIASALIDAAGNLAGRCGTALSLHRARDAVPRAAAIEKRSTVIHERAARRHPRREPGPRSSDFACSYICGPSA
jgi:hypothetical protein